MLLGEDSGTEHAVCNVVVYRLRYWEIAELRQRALLVMIEYYANFGLIKVGRGVVNDVDYDGDQVVIAENCIKTWSFCIFVIFQTYISVLFFMFPFFYKNMNILKNYQNHPRFSLTVKAGSIFDSLSTIMLAEHYWVFSRFD